MFLFSSPQRPRSAPKSVVLWLVAALVVVALSGCSSDGDDESATESSEDSEASMEFGDDGATEDTVVAPDGVRPSGADADGVAGQNQARELDGDGEGDDATSDDQPLGSGGAVATPTAADLGRKLIFTAEMTVGVDDVAAASAEAGRIVQEVGGFLFGQQTEGGSTPVSILTFKVLPDDFNRTLERLGSVGELRNQSVTTDDVTERVVDLESRIEVAELGVARLRTALETTTNLEDYAEVERLLLSRESELEVMRGQLRTLQDRIDLATITVVLTQDRVANAVVARLSAYEGHDGGRACSAGEGLRVEEGTPVTLCFEILNDGDQTLSDIELTESVLEIDASTELLPVFGDFEQLAPGQSVQVAYEFEADRPVRLRTRVTAVPTDGASPEPVGPSVTTQTQFVIDTFPSEDGPGFSDGFNAGVSILRGLWTAVVLTVSFLLPLLVLAPLVWLAWRALQAVRRRRPKASPPPAPGPPPPPPAPGPAATPAAAVRPGGGEQPPPPAG
jgi:hypothetical protein